ncbi:MAG: 1-deoxy-D-xylulose-5-phosphate synthase [Planctomycetota bacterium]|nr:1-deoxy-D-xylulose-5-phosphate synthase [Planctomycetota bacterium]
MSRARGEIMYLERKDGLTGPARIGRVRRSKSGRTLSYQQHRFVSLRGSGYKANYVDEIEGEEWWISRPRRDGCDTLYPGTVAIDDDVRAAYWLEIRERPDLVETSSFRSPGKHSRR